MERFRSILVAASPGRLEPPALRAAVDLAESNDASLTVLGVLPPLPRWRRRMNVEGRTIDVESALLHDREQRLRNLVDEVGGPMATEVVVMIGEPFLEVIRHVLDRGHDLVVLGEPGQDDAAEPQLSSGTMHVIRKCPAPVLVMRGGTLAEPRILALVDPDPGDRVRDGLNDLVLELASSMARRQHGELHVGHAWTLEEEATLRTSPFVELPGHVVDVMISETQAMHRDQLNVLARRHDLHDAGASMHLVSGQPGEVLPRLAERLDIGLIVMGTVGRTGLQGLIMGNTAETILRSVRCSVLAVKPRGFVTPVKPGGPA